MHQCDEQQAPRLDRLHPTCLVLWFPGQNANGAYQKETPGLYQRNNDEQQTRTPGNEQIRYPSGGKIGVAPEWLHIP